MSILLWLAACGTPGTADRLPLSHPDPEPACPDLAALPGHKVLRSQPLHLEAGQVFEPGGPLVWELHLPEDVAGRGLPPPLEPDQFFFDDEDFLPVVQLEIPTRRTPLGDDGSVAVENDGPKTPHFNRPRHCAPDDDCEARNTPGFWRALKVDEDTCTTEEMHVTISAADQLTFVEAVPGIISVWSEEDLPAGTRIRFEYLGRVPERATDWDDDWFLRPGIRYRIDDEPGPQRRHYRLVEDEDIDPVEVRAGRPAFLRIFAPLDAATDEPVRLQASLTDDRGNPVRVSLTVDLLDGLRDKEPLCTVSFANSFSGSCLAQFAAPGRRFVTARVPQLLEDITVVVQPVRVQARAPRYHRMVGDTHVHTGMLRPDDPTRTQRFVFNTTAGDHTSNTASLDRALRYLRDAMGYDFGAVSEHAVGDPAINPYEWLDAEGTPFAPGEPCEVLPMDAGTGDWWHANQVAAADFPAGPDFWVFPAYEWHGTTTPLDAQLHRVVLFRDHHPRRQHPILPTSLRALTYPQCLVRFLQETGYDVDKATIIPHMMRARSQNVDWLLTYGAPDGLALLPGGVEDVQDYQRVGEIFSARNYNQGFRTLGSTYLTRFETPVKSVFTFRHGWTRYGAEIGLIGSSDNHTQNPGLDDTLPDPRTDARVSQQHQPTGTAFVLAEDRSRDAIYDAILARRTYATSGIRAWVDFTAGGQPMGSDIEACGSVPLKWSISSPLPVPQVEVLRAALPEPGTIGTASFQTVAEQRPILPDVDGEATLEDPGDGRRELVYLRAFFGLSVPLAVDAAWTSPVWIDWCDP